MIGNVIVRTGDITRLTLDAIVNAANEWLLGGGGVDGAIHAAAGPQLLEACRQMPEVRPNVRCPTGEARITPGFRLPAKWVIHTVGPVWRGGDADEDALLEAAYRSSLDLAARHGVKTIAFPAISTGAYAFPLTRAARIAIATTSNRTEFERIEHVCFGAAALEAFREALARLNEE